MIIHTIMNRSYVFIFLIAFLVLGRLYFGWKRTFIWLGIGYFVALASEFSSIHNGFPYGLYHYIYENMPNEVMVFGVPFWDSLSYPFMIFAGWTAARFILNSSNNFINASFGAFLTMILDVITDPLAHLGGKWFLGEIYYYETPGFYFDVPWTNFAGWFLVAFVVIMIFQYFNTVIPAKAGISNDSPLKFLYPLFYLSIALFNIIIMMTINEPVLSSVSCFVLAPIVLFMIWRIRGRYQV